MPPIPPHGLGGVLPPFQGNEPGVENALAPYRVQVCEVVERFATSAERRAILSGWLRHRALLARLGFTDGFQWIDGSFVDVMSREPRDIDVVTFFVRPAGVTTSTIRELATRYTDVFQRDDTKAAYKVDPLFVDLSAARPDDLVRRAAYWYGLFSHQRDTFTWRGILQVSLDVSGDADAAARLSAAGGAHAGSV